MILADTCLAALAGGTRNVMSILPQIIMRMAATAFYRTRGHRLLAPLTQGCGAILMLHSVSPDPRPAFDPNGGLCITPDFLDRALKLVRAEGYDIVSLDEAHWRLVNGWAGAPFVAITLDDGYRDNLQFAYPVFRRHQAPFCIYVPTAYTEGEANLWWFGLEGAIAAGKPLRLEIDGRPREFACGTLAEKHRTWHQIYWWLRRIKEDDARLAVSKLCAQAGYDAAKLAASMIMSWDEISTLAADPLCTIGAHTVHHYALAKLDDATCLEEMSRSKTGLEAKLGKPVRHFSYPYGSEADAGPREFAIANKLRFATAVTTRKGVLFPEHRDHLMALPRLSLHGEAQDERLLLVLLGGAPFALMNRFRRVSAA